MRRNNTAPDPRFVRQWADCRYAVYADHVEWQAPGVPLVLIPLDTLAAVRTTAPATVVLTVHDGPTYTCPLLCAPDAIAAGSQTFQALVDQSLARDTP